MKLYARLQVVELTFGRVEQRQDMFDHVRFRAWTRTLLSASVAPECAGFVGRMVVRPVRQDYQAEAIAIAGPT